MKKSPKCAHGKGQGRICWRETNMSRPESKKRQAVYERGADYFG